MSRMSLKKDKSKNPSEKIAKSFALRMFDNEENPSNDYYWQDGTTTTARKQGFECNNESNSFRKQNVKFLSDMRAKYRNKILSRSDSSEDDSDGEQSKTEEQIIGGHDSDLEKYSKKLKEKCLIDSEQEYSEDDSEAIDGNAGKVEENSEVEQDSDYDSASAEEEEEGSQNDYESHTILRESNQSADLQNQLRMWEKLLEVPPPIQSQKILDKASLPPGPPDFNEFCDGSEVLSTLAQKTKQNAEGIFDQIVERFPGTKDLLKQSKKRKLRTNDEEPDIKRFANVIQGNSESFQPYCNKIDSNDDDEAGKAGVDDSQGKKEGSISCEGIYGDTDFDHQQLQKLLGVKTKSSITELQKLPQKIKKKGYTRASTRRKMRYAVRNKMVNFMGPNPYKTDESRTKLNRSLFGT